MTESITYQICPVCHGEGRTVRQDWITNIFTTCNVCNGGKVIPMYVPPPKTNELMIAILESQLKVERAKRKYINDHEKLNINWKVTDEIERQLKELKNQKDGKNQNDIP
jgi:hypothetical protein